MTMRVTTRLMVTNSLRRLSSRLESYEQKQEQLATGRRVNRTSDDPSSASRSIALRAAIRARTQESRNADDARTFLDRTDAELQGVMTSLHRVKDLTLRANNSVSAGERDAIAREIEQLRDGLVGIANARNGDRPLFAGTSDGLAVQKVAGAWQYTGDTGEVQRRVSEQDRVVVNRNASDVFGFGGAPGSDLFSRLDALVVGLDTGDATAIRDGIGDVDTAFSRVTEQLSIVGATTNRVEGAKERTEKGILTLRSELAEVQDVDLEEAIMELKVEEVAYQATLSALGQALPQSLVSFLR